MARPAHQPWIPHRYQSRAVDFLLEHGAGALVLDPGLGKTSIVLEAFRQLKAAGQAHHMLVVAPLRVCQLVWAQEGRKWSQFRDLSFSLIHGKEKHRIARLAEHADVHLINPEGVAWLSTQFYGKASIPWDTVVIDELTRFKNHRAERSKRLRKRIQDVKRCWGLTGSLIPNGYMDLFGQMLLLDGGLSLGKYITQFRDTYFSQGFNGFDYDLMTGAAEKIEAKIAPYILRMSAEDYLELPPLTNNLIPAPMPAPALAQYEEMKAELIVSLPEGTITAANSGVVYSKLKQITNGAVYVSNSLEKTYAEIHTAKIEAVQDLIEELAGQPLLIAYEFNHDLARLRNALGADTPALAGLSGRRVEEVEAAWNRGELPVLLVHPASAGHGLNLQAAAGSGTAHLCWFSLPWDLELYEQTIRRLHRQGSEADRVMNHILMTGEMDKVVLEALEEKDTTKNRLFKALNAEILRDDPAPTATGFVARIDEEPNMIKKLGFQGAAPDAAPQSNATPAPVAPRGWGAPAKTAPGVTEDDGDSLPPTKAPAATPRGWGSPAPASDQQEQIRGKIRAPVEAPEEDEDEEETPAAQRALDAFPPGLVQQLSDGVGGEDEEGADLPPAGNGFTEGHTGLSGAPPAAEAPKKARRSRKPAEEALGPVGSPSELSDAAQGNVEGVSRGTGAEAQQARFRDALDSRSAYRPEAYYPMGSFSVTYTGIPAEALASIFEALAAQFRSA